MNDLPLLILHAQLCHDTLNFDLNALIPILIKRHRKEGTPPGIDIVYHVNVLQINSYQANVCVNWRIISAIQRALGTPGL